MSTAPPPPSATTSRVFRPGDRAQLTDPKVRRHTVILEPGGAFHTSKGAIQHDDILGNCEGRVVESSNGTPYLVQRPLLKDFVLSMPRGATVVYPKDAALIVAFADIAPGSRVLEAGAGSGALSCSLLRAIGDDGQLTSCEVRPEFARIARRNVQAWFGEVPTNWNLVEGDVIEYTLTQVATDSVDRVVLDLLNPWDCLPGVGAALRPGGVLCCYVATTTQMSRLVETSRQLGGWTNPDCFETMVRDWHVEGLAVRPGHRMVGHTGFLVTLRRLADGVELPARRTRPSKGAYGADWQPYGIAGDEPTG